MRPAMNYHAGANTSDMWSSDSTSLSHRRTLGLEKTSKSHDRKRRAEYVWHQDVLNLQFADWVVRTLSKDPLASLADGGRDYIQAVKKLEDRYLRQHGAVFTFGSGECGQLAHGIDSEQDLMVRRPRIVHSLNEKQVRSIACGGLHTLTVGADGRVWSWGCNDDHALGRPTKGEEENHPGLVEGISGHVVEAACGDCHAAVVTLDGKLYTWGSYKDKEGKQFFHPPQETKDKVRRTQMEPMLLAIGDNSRVANIACGASFSVALLDDKTVMSWGLGEAGELGRPCGPMKPDGENYDNRCIYAEHMTPSLCVTGNGDPLPPMKSVGCGMYHLLVVSGSGSAVYTSGLNNYGQLGLGDTENRTKLEEVVDLDGLGVVKASGGNHHSVAMTAKGRVLAWGRADYGQLGQGAVQSSAGTFEPRPCLTKIPDGAGRVVDMACGANHNLVLTGKNRVFTWGFGESYALGHWSDKDELLPKEMDLSKSKELKNVSILQVSGGGCHSAILGSVTK